MDNQRKEYTIDELTAENNALRAENERKVFHDADS